MSLFGKKKTKSIYEMSDLELLDSFVDQLMIDKGIKAALDQATYEALKCNLMEDINFQVNRAVLSMLPEKELDKVESLMESGMLTADAFSEIIANSNLDEAKVGKVVSDVMLAYREAYLGK